MDPSHLLVRMKHFVRSSEDSSTSSVLKNESKQAPRPSFVTGTQVKQFYEKIVGKEALEASKLEVKEDKTVVKLKPVKKCSKAPFNVNFFMKAVETGNTKDVENILEQHEGSVNSQDQFGWTPLMSACFVGDPEMVQLLLRWQPNLGLRDRRGNTCRDLAAAAKHHNITEILDRCLQDTNKPFVDEHSIAFSPSVSETSTFYCKTCKQNVENSTLKKHLSSTVHNFHTSVKSKMPTFYGIPESNKGFQILIKSGWDKEGGLGPSGEGHKFPPKTILKQDRTGLGAKRYKARVTHALEDVRREGKPKRTLKSEKISSDQRLERRLRRMLS